MDTAAMAWAEYLPVNLFKRIKENLNNHPGLPGGLVHSTAGREGPLQQSDDIFIMIYCYIELRSSQLCQDASFQGMSKPKGLLITSLDALFCCLITTFLTVETLQGKFFGLQFSAVLPLTGVMYDNTDEQL